MPLFEKSVSEIRRFKRIAFLALCLGLFFPLESSAVRPVSSSLALVAGEGTGGFRDGGFETAFFRKPYGLAISEDGKQLYIADVDNNRIRVVHLDQDNRVSTLAGQDAPGKQDGSLRSASFNQPHSVAYLSRGSLVVNDFGNGVLRLVDLKKKVVSTITGSAPSTLVEGPSGQIYVFGIQDVVYLPAADSLFFTQPEQMTLKRLDLKTMQVTLVLTNKDYLPHPFALCASEDTLYVADRDLPTVLSLEWKGGKATDLWPVANSDGKVAALAKTGKCLYAIQYNDQVPLKRLLPFAESVTFQSVWGDEIPDPGKNLPHFQNPYPQWPLCFVADPLQERRFYIANPSLNFIMSFRDLPGNLVSQPGRNSNGLDEPEYPAKKPPHTFRILLVGDSRTSFIDPYTFNTTWNVQMKDRGAERPPHLLTISKHMELELNTLAALEDKPLNFEVLNKFRTGENPLIVWPTYEIPETVQKNDIDLVLILQPPSVSDMNFIPFMSYFNRPITKEGIPIHELDMEYIMKPPLARIPDGEPKLFYELCKTRNLVQIIGNNLVFDQKLFLDPGLHEALVQLYGKPVDILNRKLSDMKTSSGKHVRLLICSIHAGVFKPTLEDPQIWADVTKRLHIPFLDMNDQMTVLWPTYFPITLAGGWEHFNPDGHLFLGTLLVHNLIRDGLIPWGK
jgi:hypothetical protein